MSRQDRQGVRTAVDLERKYDFASMQKAVENSVKGINKTNKTLQDFIVQTTKEIDDLKEITDGNITTWFYSGVPTFDALPTSEWITDELKEEHLGDLYYDRDTGNGYRFIVVDGEYKWVLTDQDVASVLAIANAAQDTADSKRRVFVEQPVPPYDNGDLWFNEKEIYICQITKAATETYEENDFIIATKYTDDTVANKVGDELQVLEGSVLTVIEDADKLKVELEDLDNKTSSEIEFLKNSLNVEITDLEAKTDAINADLQEKFNIITKYFTFDIDGLTIGAVDSPFKVVVDNDRYSMLVNGVEVLWLDPDGSSNIPNLTVTTMMNLCGYVIDSDDSSETINCGWGGDS